MKGMKKFILIPATLAALFVFAACGAQSQTPQADDQGDQPSQSNERPETVTVYRDDTADDAAGDAADENTNGNTSGSSGGGDEGTNQSADSGEIIEDRDDDFDDDREDSNDADDNMQSGQQLPKDFPVPVPDEYQVQAVGEVGNETSAVLEAPSGEDAYNYYRQSLADAGFRVIDEGRNESGYFEAELEFSNDELEGNIDFDGDTVEVDIERYR